VNQTLGTNLALIFLAAVGLFNFALGASDVRKRNRNHFLGWLRIALGVALAACAVWFYRHLGRGLFG
jgi:hypothetical protein